MNIAKRAVRGALNALPDWPAVDRAEALAAFRVAHGRWPRRGSGLYNDRLFFFKTDAAWMEAPLRVRCTDKELAKGYIRETLGWDAAPRTLALIERPGDVTAEAFPAPSIIKPTHLQGEFIHHDGSRPLDEAELARIRGWFDRRIYRSKVRERNYRTLQPRVIAEEPVGDPFGLSDWRMACWKGRVRLIMQVDRAPRAKAYYSRDWEHLPITYGDAPNLPRPRPVQLGAMVAAADALAAGFDFIRVDLYASDERFWVGELTSVPQSANGRFASLEDERRCHDVVFGAP